MNHLHYPTEATPLSSPSSPRESLSLSSSPPALPNMKNRRITQLIVPETNPLAWTVINCLVFLWSTVVLVLITTTSEGVIQRRYGEQMYISWNFGTTTIWCLEIGLMVWFHGQASTWEQRIELLLAVYFLFDSVHLFVKWRNPKEDLEEEFFDVLINDIAFLWIHLSTLHRFCSRSRPAQKQQERDGHAKEEQEQESQIVRAMYDVEADNCQVDVVKRTTHGGTTQELPSTKTNEQPTTKRHAAETVAPPVVSQEADDETQTQEGDNMSKSESATTSDDDEPRMLKVSQKYPQFFGLKEGQTGWGHASFFSRKQQQNKKPKVRPLNKRTFAQFFALKEGNRGWGHASFVDRDAAPVDGDVTV